MVDEAISSYETHRNNSPNPTISLSNKTEAASGVPSRPVSPVPPEVIIISTLTGTANFAQQSFPKEWQATTPLIIGTFNLVAGLITTIAQFLRVSELLEGNRSASIGYDKFARNISVELSLPIRERELSGSEFISKCRLELDKLIEQSPNIPQHIIYQFSKKFEEKAFSLCSSCLSSLCFHDCLSFDKRDCGIIKNPHDNYHRD